MHLELILSGDGSVKEDAELVKAGKVVEAVSGKLILLRGGMQSGKPSVMFYLTMPDGSRVYFQSSLAILETAAKAMRARACSPGELAGD